MKLKIILAAAAASALMSGAAFAQPTDQAPASGAVNPSTGAAPADQTTTTTTTTTPDAAVPATGAATSTSTTATDTATGTSVTTTLTTNGPVPDTAENRAKYGGPMSHAGKHTAAKGN
jgi:hypothetical protein